MQLEGKAHAQVRSLSGGMRRRLVIARALMGSPEILVLDEPTTGLDPQARILVWTKIRELKRQGVTILLTTHYMDEAERLADHLLVIDHGHVLERGTPRELIRRVVGEDSLEIPEVDAEALDRIEAVLSRHQAVVDHQAGTLLVYGEKMDDVIEHLHESRLWPVPIIEGGLRWRMCFSA